MSTAHATAALRDTPASAGQQRLEGARGSRRTRVTGDEQRGSISICTLRKRNTRGEVAEQVGGVVVNELHRMA